MYAETYNNITNLTRRESYLTRPTARQSQILYTLGTREMTARQLCYEMGFTDLNSVKPRLTELKQQGRVVAVGKAYDELTGKNVAVWRKV